MNRALVILSTLPVIVLVLLMGSIADFDTYSRTAYAIGVVTGIPGFLIGGWIQERAR